MNLAAHTSRTLDRLIFTLGLDVEEMSEVRLPSTSSNQSDVAQDAREIRLKFHFSEVPEQVLHATLTSRQSDMNETLDVCISQVSPLRQSEVSVLSGINALNRKGTGASESYDAERRVLEVRSFMQFSGYTTSACPEHPYRHARAEATLNWFVQCFGLAQRSLMLI